MDGGASLEGMAGVKRPTPIVRDAETLFRRGIDALERERYEEAAGLLRQAAEMSPRLSAVHLALGIALSRMYEMSGATRALETAVELDPAGFFPHFRLGELYMRLGVPSRANEELRRAMDLSTTEEQRSMVRQLWAADAKRGARRIWRPDFSRLMHKPKGKQ